VAHSYFNQSEDQNQQDCRSTDHQLPSQKTITGAKSRVGVISIAARPKSKLDPIKSSAKDVSLAMLEIALSHRSLSRQKWLVHNRAGAYLLSCNNASGV
jgi:hypothetical protein